jgi:hypothetical protein
LFHVLNHSHELLEGLITERVTSTSSSSNLGKVFKILTKRVRKL